MSDPVLVVGGGIGGLTTALALRHHEIPCVVLEQAPELREIGAGLGLWPASCTRGRALVGADGQHSRVRVILFGVRSLHDCKYRGWRGTATQPRGTDWHVFIGETWGPGCRFGILPIADDRVTWYAATRSPDPTAREPSSSHGSGTGTIPSPSWSKTRPTRASGATTSTTSGRSAAGRPARSR
jgi:2-polyprenyl-6-methoxyphenol hydroxylase-like FAD-dependent oxidoreductase